MTRESSLLTADRVAFSYLPQKTVLADVSIAVGEGELTCILGPNGCGKTTLLKCLMGRVSASSGTIEVLGREVSSYGPRELARVIV